MEKITDWYGLWAALSELQNRAFSRTETGTEEDFWKKKAKKYDGMVDKRWARPDSSRDFVIGRLKAHPGASLLDIGAGTGKWSVLAAAAAGKVTALDPSAAMQAVLKEKIDIGGIANIDMVTGSWPDHPVPPHDYVLASHSMYGVADFKGFVTGMNQTAKKGCMMVLRVPYMDSVMAAASRKVLGQPYDSPNFQIAYNCLLGMDIYPDVIMEAKGAWPGWEHDSLEAALEEVKNRLGIAGKDTFDAWLTDLLEERLIRKNGGVAWPDGNRSALVYWDVPSCG